MKEPLEKPISLREVPFSLPPEELDDYELEGMRELYLSKMQDAGYTIILPKRDELLLDIDTIEQAITYKTNFHILRRYYQINQTRVVNSKSGGLHITVKFPRPLGEVERIAWQAALGSDPTRELLSLIRSYAQLEAPTLFAELPQDGLPTSEDDIPF